MEKRDAKDLIKLHKILGNPSVVEHYQEVFSFVKAITDKCLNPHDLTANTIERWNRNITNYEIPSTESFAAM